MVEKICRWESELWSYLSSGDGMHCPIYSHCQVRQKGGWCPDDDKERLNRLLDDERFNFTNYDFIKCGTCGRVFEVVEMMAQRYLEKGGVRYPPVPTELFSLADKQHTIEVRVLPLKAYHGAIWRLKDGWVIQLKDDDISATKRLTLFHEAFHILAHCSSSDTPVFRRRGTTQGSFNELVADAFATFTLMPREWVEEKWAAVHDLDQMVKLFDVPRSAMCIRLKRLGLV